MKRAAVMGLMLLASGAHSQSCDKACDWSFWDSAPASKIMHVLEVVDPDSRGQYGHTPLHMAAKSGTVENINYLIDRGANIDAQDQDGWTPLHLAALAGPSKNVNTLIKAGAQVNQQSSEGWTPLMEAIRTGREDIILLLLKSGANVSLKDSSGDDAWAYAQGVEGLKGTEAYGALNEARYK